METESRMAKVDDLLNRIDDLVGEETPEELEIRMNRRESRKKKS